MCLIYTRKYQAGQVGILSDLIRLNIFDVLGFCFRFSPKRDGAEEGGREGRKRRKEEKEGRKEGRKEGTQKKVTASGYRKVHF